MEIQLLQFQKRLLLLPRKEKFSADKFTQDPWCQLLHESQHMELELSDNSAEHVERRQVFVELFFAFFDHIVELMFATDLYQYKIFLEPKKVACCCTLCLEGWEYCSRVLETSLGFYANTDSSTVIPIVLWQYREVNVGIKRSGVSTATPASNPWKDLFNKFITTTSSNWDSVRIFWRRDRLPFIVVPFAI